MKNRWYVYHSQSWVVYDVVFPTLLIYIINRNWHIMVFTLLSFKRFANWQITIFHRYINHGKSM